MSDFEWPKVERFLSADEIVDVLYERLKDDDSVYQFVNSDPIMYHHGFGTGVRNEFWLWHPENPYTMKDYEPQIVDGSDHNPRHADNYCGVILEKLHARLKEYVASKNVTTLSGERESASFHFGKNDWND